MSQLLEPAEADELLQKMVNSKNPPASEEIKLDAIGILAKGKGKFTRNTEAAKALVDTL
jgi:hypothetical protein